MVDNEDSRGGVAAAQVTDSAGLSWIIGDSALYQSSALSPQFLIRGVGFDLG
jgi:hypothetical protein